jgi:hypothetical protein
MARYSKFRVSLTSVLEYYKMERYNNSYGGTLDVWVIMVESLNIIKTNPKLEYQSLRWHRMLRTEYHWLASWNNIYTEPKATIPLPKNALS